VAGGGGAETMTGLVHGVHAVASLLERRPKAIREALLQAGRPGKTRAELAAALEARQVPVKYVSRAELDQLTGGARHQGVAVRVAAPTLESESALKDLVVARGEQLCLLVLDGVQDPRNLGACLRTAAAAGADAVVTPKDRAARLTPAAIKAAAGAAELTPVIRVTNLARALSRLADAGVSILGLAGQGSPPLDDVPLQRPIALVLGGEQRGLRRLTRERCQALAAIPMAGGVESLNVAVAAGVALFELNRRTRG
jgi:23S rRNA (guanosine2251-2'-O)-methyltransferase